MDSFTEYMRRKANGHPANHSGGLGGYPGLNFYIPAHQAASLTSPVPESSETDANIEWVENLGLFILRDTNVIQRVNRRFCGRVVDVLARSRKVRLAHVHLENHELVVQFADPRTERAEAARILGEAVRLASMPVNAESIDSSRAARRWSGFTAFASETGPVTSWRSREVGQNRLRLDGELLERPETTSQELLGLIPSLKSVHRRWLGRGVTVKFDPDQTRPLELIGAIDTICRIESVSLLPDIDENPLASLSLTRRVWHLGLAVASMGGAIVGLVLPGIPTVPFVLLTSYHLAKGSDRMHRIFLRMPLFGSLAHDWSDGRYIRLENKIILICITSGIVGVTLMFTPVSLGVLTMVGVVYSVTTISILTTPGQPQVGLVPKVGISRGLKSLPALG